MQSTRESAKLITEDGHVLCPTCRRMKLLRLPPDGKVRAFAWCRHCRMEQKLDIDLSLSR